MSLSLSLYAVQENAEMVSTDTSGEHGINIVIVYGSLLEFKYIPSIFALQI